MNEIVFVRRKWLWSLCKCSYANYYDKIYHINFVATKMTKHFDNTFIGVQCSVLEYMPGKKNTCIFEWEWAKDERMWLRVDVCSFSSNHAYHMLLTVGKSAKLFDLWERERERPADTIEINYKNYYNYNFFYYS